MNAPLSADVEMDLWEKVTNVSLSVSVVARMVNATTRYFFVFVSIKFINLFYKIKMIQIEPFIIMLGDKMVMNNFWFSNSSSLQKNYGFNAPSKNKI